MLLIGYFFLSCLFLLAKAVKFNWLITKQTDSSVKRTCIDLEYRLRPKITQFLMSRLEAECCGDFTCFHFDVDLDNHWIYISEKTPKDFIERIKRDFDIEINGSKLFSVA